jgi:hypothetical protein
MAQENSALREILEDRYGEYWAWLGKFTHEFSRVERLLQTLLRVKSGVSESVGRAIFSDLRMQASKDAVNRICDALGDAETKERLKPAFDQLGEINAVRNNLVHWGAVHDGSDALLVTNVRLIASADRLQEFRISPRDLRAMSLDLFLIGIYVVDAGRAFQFWDEPDFATMREGAWLYKPPQRSPSQKAPNRGRTKGRARQRRASPK